MGLDLEEDLKRKMIELNLIAGRKAQSVQTGYIHLNYDSEDRHDTIPLLENFCFILALIRSRLSDQILEGKTLLDKLLAFEVDGNFPIFLHDFPQCKDRSFSLKLLPIFHQLLADFRTALSEQLAIRLELLISRIISHGYKMHQQRSLSKSAEFRLKSYFESDSTLNWEPLTPEEWVEVLVTMQMTRHCLLSDELFERALQLWHPYLCTYIGPQQYEREEPKVTLFDLFLGHYYGLYSRRALENQRIHLLASLIPCLHEKGVHFSWPTLCHAIDNHSSQPYTLYWGTPQQLNSFVFNQKQTCSSIVRLENEIDLLIYLPAIIPEDGDAFEVTFYVNLSSSLNICIKGVQATTFQLGDDLKLYSDDVSLNLSITLERGEGRFFGHISRANRPMQKARNLKYETYDWQIALRTIRRSEECVLRVKLVV